MSLCPEKDRERERERENCCFLHSCQLSPSLKARVQNKEQNNKPEFWRKITYNKYLILINLRIKWGKKTHLNEIRWSRKKCHF